MGWLQIAVYVVLLVLLAKPLGEYMARVYAGERTFLTPVLGGLERMLLRLLGVRPDDEAHWKRYGAGLLAFNALGFLAVYALQRAQHVLPLNPAELGPVSPHSSFNTAVSFATNTNWQGYAGETTLSYLVQMLGLTVQNFVSAATGMAVLVALIRGFARRTSATIGSFWVDLVRSTVHVLLPLSVMLALALVSRGVVQTLDGPASVQLLDPITADGEGVATTEQVVPLGPAASQIAIKQLGTNGGGFFNANSAHPLENPDPFTNLLESLAILVIPAALCFTFGAMVRDRRQGIALLAAMLILLVPSITAVYALERAGTPALAAAGVRLDASDDSGGNLEGKEVRFGQAQTAIWVAATTAASNGSVNAMHDSLTPLGGLVPMVLMQLGEVVFGGAGSGLYGMLAFAIVAVFVAGLMVGRTPEYLGKKIGAYEMKMAALAILAPCIAVLVGTAVACVTGAGRAGALNPGVHGFSEILYAFSSAANNNGSAFAGLTANTPFYDTALGLAMLAARYVPIVVVLGLAGALAEKKIVPAGAGTLPTHGPLFVVLLLGTVLLVGALTFLPALALGPIVEHLQMIAGAG